jgi:hypothetical protein
MNLLEKSCSPSNDVTSDAQTLSGFEDRKRVNWLTPAWHQGEKTVAPPGAVRLGARLER